MKRFLTIALAGSLLLTLAACGGTTTAATDGTSEGDSAAKKWVKVSTLKGSTNKTGPSFALKGGEQKLAYTIKGGASVIAGIYLEKAGTDVQADGGIPVAMPDKAGSDSTRLNKDAGKYQIIVTSANCDWTVTVSELR